MHFEVITKDSKLTPELLNILQNEWPEAYGWLTDVMDGWSLTDFPQIVVPTENKEIIGYKFVHLGKMMEAVRKGTDPKEAYESNIKTYGRYDDAVTKIDPRKE